MGAKWKCYPEHQPRVRNMYLRTMAVLRKQETFEELKKVAEAIFMLALCPTIGKSSLADEALQFLKRKIRDLPDDIGIKEEENSSGSESQPETVMSIIEDSEFESTNIYSWATKFYDNCEMNAKKEPEYEEINAYHLPKFAGEMKTLLPWFSIFSEVMRYSCGFGTKDATSAPIESEFNDLKNRKFHNIQFPLRADKFVAFHLKALKNQLTEIAAGNIQLTTTGEYEPIMKNKKRKNDEFEDYGELNEEHDWRHKNKKEKLDVIISNDYLLDDQISATLDEGVIICNNPVQHLTTDDSLKEEKEEKLIDQNDSILINTSSESVTSKEDFSEICGLHPVADLRKTREQRMKNKRKTKKFRYGDPFPHFEPSQKKHLSLPVLPNANNCKNVKDKSTIFVLKRTCAFDSLCQIVSSAILNHESYKEATEHLDSGIFRCAKILISEGLKVSVYKQRAITLQDVTALHVETTEHRKSNNRKVTITKIEGSCNIGTLGSLLFSDLPSSIIQGQCPACKRDCRETLALLLPNYNTLQDRGLVTLGNTIKTVNFPPITCCGKPIKTTVHYGPNVLIDVGLGRAQSVVELCSIETRITLDNSEYGLIGLVAYEGAYKTDYVGHYIAYIYSGRHWVSYDDLLRKPSVVEANSEIDPQLLVFIKTNNCS